MPVTHGVAGSSPVRTAKSLEASLRGFCGFIPLGWVLLAKKKLGRVKSGCGRFSRLLVLLHDKKGEFALRQLLITLWLVLKKVMVGRLVC